MAFSFRSRKIWLALPLVVLLAGAGFWLLKGSQPGQTASAPAAIRTLELSAADLARVSQGPFARSVELAGELQPVRQTILTAQIEGEVQQVNVRAGEAVKAGQELARFSTRDLAQKVAVQEAIVAKSREQLQQQQKVETRNRQLLEQRFISQNAFDATRSQSTVFQADLQASLAELALARQSMNYAVVSAPFAGVVAERKVEPGQHVGMNAHLFSVVDLDELELSLQVPVRALASIAAGQTVHFRVEGFPQEFSGTVARVAPQADASRSVPVFVKVDNRNGPLKGGMYAQARLDLAARSDVLSVPQAAIREEQGATYVFTVQDGRIARRKVAVLESNPSTGMAAVEGTAGGSLPAGTLVLRIAPPGTGDGQPVRLPKGYQ